jgi:hypothetical protein
MGILHGERLLLQQRPGQQQEEREFRDGADGHQRQARRDKAADQRQGPEQGQVADIEQPQGRAFDEIANGRRPIAPNPRRAGTAPQKG